MAKPYGNPARRLQHRVNAELSARLNADAGPAQVGIVAELRRFITDGDVAPGFPLPVDDLAAIFSVSAIPVREALKTLQGEGLVEHLPRAGYAVARLTLADYCDLYVARQSLEAAALQRAAESADEDDLNRIRSAHEQLDDALAAGDVKGWHRGSRTFHEMLVQPCGMPRLLDLLRYTWNITDPAQSMTLVEEAALRTLHEEHAEMLDCMIARDFARLIELAEEHASHVLDEVRKLPAGHEFFSPPTP